jgi:hypothetical protein
MGRSMTGLGRKLPHRRPVATSAFPGIRLESCHSATGQDNSGLVSPLRLRTEVTRLFVSKCGVEVRFDAAKRACRVAAQALCTDAW